MKRFFLALAVVLCASQLSACGVTEYQRFLDRAKVARADLNSPEMTARICAAGADTAACRK